MSPSKSYRTEKNIRRVYKEFIEKYKRKELKDPSFLDYMRKIDEAYDPTSSSLSDNDQTKVDDNPSRGQLPAKFGMTCYNVHLKDNSNSSQEGVGEIGKLECIGYSKIQEIATGIKSLMDEIVDM